MLLLLEKGDANLVSNELPGCRWRPFLDVGVGGLQEGVLHGTFCRMDRLRSTSPRMPPEAVKADMPAKLSPVLAMLVDKTPPRPGTDSSRSSSMATACSPASSPRLSRSATIFTEQTSTSFAGRALCTA
ncbi:hypothetical protein J7E62_28655 [Variovorax paradoxus]|nr:hypothetical protein [Variovorax paradoxus]